MAFKRRSDNWNSQEEWDKMTTQKELFAKLKARGPQQASDDRPPLAPFIKFRNEGEPIQGEVIDTFVTTAWDPKTKAKALDKNGNEVPQLTVTLKLHTDKGEVREDGKRRDPVQGETVRQGFTNDLLWKLQAALEEQGLEELPNGAVIASVWEGKFGNTNARDHKVIVKVAE